MSKKYRYAPADNSTPVNHPIFGHLEAGEIYDDPRCKDDPNFKEVSRGKVHSPEPEIAPNPDPVSEAEPGTPENPIVVPEPEAAPVADEGKGASSSSDQPAKESAGAGKTGRSKS